MNLFQKYYKTFTQSGERIAFVEEKRMFRYEEFLQLVSGGRGLLEQQAATERTPVGILCHNRSETYAAIFSCWFAGHPIVPLNPDNPDAWNSQIITDLGINLLFDCQAIEEKNPFPEVVILNNKEVRSDYHKLPFSFGEDDPVYILTTSGSTGIPKRVPVSLKNLTAFTDGFLELFPLMGSDDSFLQTYDLTADAAFTAFLIPLLLGASVALVPDHPFRYLSVAKTLMTRQVTWVQVTPAMLLCLKPYFPKLRLDTIRYFHLGGESLSSSLVEEFRPCIPNAEIGNIYGPTETTVTTLVYKCQPGETLKQYNGSVSIGKPLTDCILMLLDEEGRMVVGEGTGELLIGGPQVMEGYWTEDREEPFRRASAEGRMVKFYRTGDKVRRDGDGFYYFLGRLNCQVKISGFRIDLSEVEWNSKRLWPASDFVAIAPEVTPGHKKLILFAINFSLPEADAIAQANRHYPEHLVPERILPISNIPVNTSGKTDRKQLEELYLSMTSHER